MVGRIGVERLVEPGGRASGLIVPADAPLLVAHERQLARFGPGGRERVQVAAGVVGLELSSEEANANIQELRCEPDLAPLDLAGEPERLVVQPSRLARPAQPAQHVGLVVQPSRTGWYGLSIAREIATA